MISLKQQLALAKKIAGNRAASYAKWIQERRMTPEEAQDDKATMAAIVETIELRVDLEEVTADILRDTA